jgi:hypothetical protein
MKLMLNESLVSTSDNDTLTLTNMRIRYVAEGDGVSILLENIQSVSLQLKSYPVLFFLGVLGLIAAFTGFGGTENFVMLCITLGILLILAYYYTRRHYLIIASSADKINVLIKGQRTSKVIEMVDRIEETICQRKADMRSAS